MIRFCVIYSCVPNKQEVLTIRQGGWGGWGGGNFKKSNSRGGVGKMKKIQFLCKMKYKLFNVYYLQSKEHKGKSSVKKYQTK